MPFIIIQHSGSRPEAFLIEDLVEDIEKSDATHTNEVPEFHCCHNPNPTIDKIRVILYKDDGSKEVLFLGNKFSEEGFDPN